MTPAPGRSGPAAPQAATARPPARPLLVAAALGIVYVVWGSTYLGIKVMVEEMPPLQSAGTRYLAAGLLLGGLLAALSGHRRLAVTRSQLAGCALLGLLLPALGNGLVTVGEFQGAPSGVTALLIAGVPLWVVLYRLASGDRPGLRTMLGVLVGLGGLAGLVGLSGFAGDLPAAALLLIVFATVCWSFGSWVQPRLTLPRDPFVVAVYEMVVGGLLMTVAGLARGETWDWDGISARSWTAWAYLVVIGSVVAFSAYVWVLDAAPISLVATYAYVNPVVAVFLGWLVLGEPVTTVVVVSGGVVLVAVAIVIGAERRTHQALDARAAPDTADARG
jgi:drug/metabolite transporter (DMT)-like permease